VRSGERRRSEFDRRLSALTPRELEVMDLVVTGLHNRKSPASWASAHAPPKFTRRA